MPMPSTTGSARSSPTEPRARTEGRGAGRRLDPHLLGYLMGPAALVAILIMRRYHLVAREPVLTWLAVFVLIPLVSATVDALYRRKPSDPRLRLRVACHAAAVTVVIYLSGWGPVLIGAFVFVALENIAHDGSRTWPTTMGWSLTGVLSGQLMIWWGWMPSLLSNEQAQALGLMGSFVLVFVIRMAGAAAEQKEDAEAAMRASEDRFRSLVQHSSDTTLVISTDQTITYASPATASLLGRAPESVVGVTALELVHPDDRERAALQLAARLTENAQTDPVEFRMEHQDGTWRDVEAVISDLRQTQSVAGFVANLRDTTERKEAEALLAHQAVHDPLTGLANRTLILDRAEQMLARCARSHEPAAALFVDLDNFKDVNDTLGHEGGDKLLQAIAGRFLATVRVSDTVGRLGGDEFVILTEGSSLAAGPELLAERLHRVLNEPFHLEGFDGRPVVITGSIGISSGLRGSAEELLRDADLALYRAKGEGKDRWVLFEPAMQSEVLDRLGLKMDLQSALDRDEFYLLYQPLFDLATTRIYGVEALIRWKHPTRGIVGPDEFIPMLEESGLIIEVGRWVLAEACLQTAEWKRHGYDLTVSVNVSMRQLETSSLIDHVRQALDVAGLDAGSLLLEITETALMRDADSTITRLTKLKSLGVQIAIDDFGTGYSSLAYLKRFPIDILKIDQSFVRDLPGDAEDAAIAAAVIGLAHSLKLDVVAEGVETREQRDFLHAHGCRRAQGRLYSMPLAAPDCTTFLRSRREGRRAPARAPSD